MFDFTSPATGRYKLHGVTSHDTVVLIFNMSVISSSEVWALFSSRFKLIEIYTEIRKYLQMQPNTPIDVCTYVDIHTYINTYLHTYIVHKHTLTHTYTQANSNKISNLIIRLYIYLSTKMAPVGAVGWNLALKLGRTRVQLPMESLGFLLT